MSLCLGALAWADRAKVYPAPSASPQSLRDSVARVLSLSDDAMLAIVPKQSGIFFTRCPGCDAGMADSGDWEWSPAAPERLKCKGCGAEFPGNARFPDDKNIEVKAPDGVHGYPY